MQITVFTTPNCVQCQATKRQFDRLGIRYYEVALEKHPELIGQFKEQGHTQAPIVVTDTKVWSGFRLDKIKSLAHHLFGESKSNR